MAKREKKKIVNKKHLARQEREAIQMRYIKYGSAALLAIVAILVGYALINAYYIIPNQPVAVVNGEKISVEDYENRVKFERYHILVRIDNTARLMETMGSDENIMQYLQNTLQQYLFQLQPDVHGPMVLNNMVDDLLISQEAARLGITVSEADIDAYIEEMFGYTPEDEASPEPPPLDDTAPTPTVYTEEAFREDYQNLLKQYQETINLSEAQFRKLVATQVLRGKVFEEITKDLPNEEEQVWARHILVKTEEEAQDVLARLNAGEDFADLAQEVSIDSSTASDGGDLGWFGHGKMVPEFEEVAFSLEPGEISDPVETVYGYHIIQVMDKGIRPMSDDDYEQKKRDYFENWLATLRDAAEIEKTDRWKEVYPEVPPTPTGY